MRSGDTGKRYVFANARLRNHKSSPLTLGQALNEYEKLAVLMRKSFEIHEVCELSGSFYYNMYDQHIPLSTVSSHFFSTMIV